MTYTNQARAAPLRSRQKQRDSSQESEARIAFAYAFSQAADFLQEIHPSFLRSAVTQVVCQNQ